MHVSSFLFETPLIRNAKRNKAVKVKRIGAHLQSSELNISRKWKLGGDVLTKEENRGKRGPEYVC